MKIQIRDTHEAKLLTVEQGEAYSPLEQKLIESIDNRYILKPAGPGMEDGNFSYDISELENFREYLINRKLNRTEMIGFLAQLKAVIATLEDHMLTDANLLMDPEAVFIDRFNRKVRFIPVCQMQGSFGSRLKPLAEVMFLHADLSDTESLRFASSMLRTVMKGDIRMHDLMELIECRNPQVSEHLQQTPRTAPVFREACELPAAKPCREGNIRPFGEDHGGDGEVTMRLTEEDRSAILPVRKEEPQPETEGPVQEKTGVKGFFSGLLTDIKMSFSNEE